MNILIVEDEFLIAEMLKEMLTDLGHLIVAIVKNYKATEVVLQKNPNIDFCFLDINLKSDKSGMDVAALINEKYKLPFAFLTSYSDKATVGLAMEHNPEAYLLKPFTEADLFITLSLISKRKAANVYVNNSILIKDGSKSIKLDSRDVIWLKSDSVYVEIKTKSKKHLVRNSLSAFLAELKSDNIIRIHRAFAVNINYVEAISGQHIIIGDEKFPLSRKHRNEFIAKFK